MIQHCKSWNFFLSLKLSIHKEKELGFPIFCQRFFSLKNYANVIFSDEICEFWFTYFFKIWKLSSILQKLYWSSVQHFRNTGSLLQEKIFIFWTTIFYKYLVYLPIYVGHGLFIHSVKSANLKCLTIVRSSKKHETFQVLNCFKGAVPNYLGTFIAKKE